MCVAELTGTIRYMNTAVEPNLEELPVDRTDAPNPDLIPSPNYAPMPAASEHWDIGFFSQFGRDLGYSLGSFFCLDSGLYRCSVPVHARGQYCSDLYWPLRLDCLLVLRKLLRRR